MRCADPAMGEQTDVCEVTRSARATKVDALLIVPSFLITTPSHRARWRWRNVLNSLRNGLVRQAWEMLTTHLLSAEVLHYADVAALLGAGRTFIVGAYYPDYTRSSPGPYSRYPSLCKTPAGTPVRERDVGDLLPHVDAVVIGTRAGAVGDRVRRLAKARGVFVAMLDHCDDLAVYGSPEAAPLTGGLRYGYDYDLYFKHDIPLGRASGTLLPLAPMPVRPESFPQVPADGRRPIPVFYRGQQRLTVLRGDRAQLAALLRDRIPGAVIDNQPVRKTYALAAYWRDLARARIAFSPSGKVWDSTRHTEAAMFGCVPLMPLPDCETVRGAVRDGEQIVGYRTARLPDGRYAVVDPEGTIDRVRDLLRDERALERMGRAWRDTVLAHHTTRARAHYLLEAIGERL